MKRWYEFFRQWRIIRSLLVITYSNSQLKTHQIAQICHSEPQKRQYTATEVLLQQLKLRHSSILVYDNLFPCKIRAGISAGIPPGSWRDFGRQDFFSQRESRRDPGKILAGKQNSRRPKSCRDRSSNLTKILAGKQKSRQPKSHRDPAANLAKILAEKQKSRRPKSWRNPAAKLTKILAESNNPGS